MSQPQLVLGLHNWSKKDPGSWQYLLDRAIAADLAGVDQLVVSDHVVMGSNLAAYNDPSLGGREGALLPTDSDGHWLEPLTLLAVIAGLTTNIRLGTGVLLAALRRPVVLAKSIATLDVLSRGRVDLGVGVGWQKEEYDAAGLSFSDRGRLLDQTLEVCKLLWENESAAFDSPELKFDNIHCVPKPANPAGIPLWIGATINSRSLTRIVRFANGWIPWGQAMFEPCSGIARIKRALDDAGRNPSEFMVRGLLALQRAPDGRVDLQKTMAPVTAMADDGITHFLLEVPLPREQEAAFDCLSEIVTEFREHAS
jgi:probable F420-dependent oxidoreductase